jgi:hypothetical protein
MWTLPANNSRHDAEFCPPAGTIRLVLHRTDTDHGRTISRRADFSGVTHGFRGHERALKDREIAATLAYYKDANLTSFRCPTTRQAA